MFYNEWGSAYFKFTSDFQNVDRRRSERKELMSKKLTQHVLYKTCSFLSCPIEEKKTWNNQNVYVLLAGKPLQQLSHVLPWTQGKTSYRQRQWTRRVTSWIALQQEFTEVSIARSGNEAIPFLINVFSFLANLPPSPLPPPPPTSPNVSSGFSHSLLLVLLYPRRENKCTRTVLKTLNKTTGHRLS